MTARAMLLAALLPLQAILAQTPTPAGAPHEAAAIIRDTDLERRAEVRRAELATWTTPEANRKVGMAVLGLLDRIRSGNDGDFVDVTRRQVNLRFRKLKPAQADLLAFLVLAETARAIANRGQIDPALQVESEVDQVHTAELTIALRKDSALMGSIKVLLEWSAGTKAQTLAGIK